jgi:hypothetical protein
MWMRCAVDTLPGFQARSASVDRREVFAGRTDQLAALNEVVMQRGQHGVISGERGVGKTEPPRVFRRV